METPYNDLSFALHQYSSGQKQRSDWKVPFSQSSTNLLLFNLEKPYDKKLSNSYIRHGAECIGEYDDLTEMKKEYENIKHILNPFNSNGRLDRRTKGNKQPREEMKLGMWIFVFLYAILFGFIRDMNTRFEGSSVS
jgi:hypothetical protein